MALIDLPIGARFKSVRWDLSQPAQVNRSGWSGGRRVVIVGAPVWRVSASIIPITRELLARPWRAFLVALEGPANTFRMPAYNIIPPSGNPTVAEPGAAAGTSSVPTAGGKTAVTGSYATIPLAGGMVQLVVLTAPLAANGAMAFKPRLRAAPTVGGVINLLNPFAEVALIGDTVSFDGQEGQQFNFAFDAEEAF